MFRSLAVNTAISAAAYFVVSVVGLLLVPLLVSTYGLVEFGLVVLARLLLPTGVLAPFDLGVSETATVAIARARSDGSWGEARGQLRRLFQVAAVMGCLLGAVLAGVAGAVTSVLQVEAAHAEGFTVLLWVTAACLPALFPALVAEGVVKGFEAYRALRAIEVLTALAYAGAVVIVVAAGMGYAGVVVGFLLAQLLRAALAAWLAARVAHAALASAAAVDTPATRAALVARCRLMTGNKTVGMLQVQAAPALCGVLLGPAAAGLYDVLARLPRFAKSVVGLLNSALLPVAARLDAGERARDMRRLGRTGLIIVAVGALPPLVAGAVFSEPILRLWVGAAFADLWGWQAAMFLVPALGALVGFGGTALLGRPLVVARMNRLACVQLVIQFGLAGATLALWDARAFIFGQVAAMSLTFPFQLALILREQGVAEGVWPRLGGVVAVGLGLAAAAFALGLPGWPATIPGLMLALAGWTLVYWAVLLVLLPTRAEHQRLRDLLARRGRPAARPSDSAPSQP